MIDGWGDFRNNLNMVYIALAMVAPMGILMLATMGGMYPNKRLNLFSVSFSPSSSWRLSPVRATRP